MLESERDICLCFPCILHYLGGYIHPDTDDQVYPILQQRGFTKDQQLSIAEEWYWVSFERETAVNEYLQGYSVLRDGCWWRPPPPTNTEQYRATPSPSSAGSNSVD